MPIYEFVCPIHGKFESLEKQETDKVLCRLKFDCRQWCERVAFSVPAKRNPEYGIQK